MYIFTIDGVRPLIDLNRCHLADRNLGASWSINKARRDRFGRSPGCVVKSNDQIEGALVFQYLRDSFTVESGIDRFGEVLGAKSDCGSLFAIQIYL